MIDKIAAETCEKILRQAMKMPQERSCEPAIVAVIGIFSSWDENDRTDRSVSPESYDKSTLRHANLLLNILDGYESNAIRFIPPNFKRAA